VNRRLFLFCLGGIASRREIPPARVGLLERLRVRLEWDIMLREGDYDRIGLFCPTIDHAFAHLSTDVMELKAAGIDHELFHVPRDMPIADIWRLSDGHSWKNATEIRLCG
jgi:hypothetical protein